MNEGKNEIGLCTCGFMILSDSKLASRSVDEPGENILIVPIRTLSSICHYTAQLLERQRSRKKTNRNMNHTFSIFDVSISCCSVT